MSQRRPRPFQLLNLPYLARIEAIRSMELETILKLSFTSRRMQKCLKSVGIKIDFPKIVLRDGFASILNRTEDFQLFCNKDGFKISRKHQMWLHVNPSTLISNTSAAIHHLQNTFRMTHLEIRISKNVPKSIIEEINTDSILKKWTKFSVFGRKMKKRELNMIMENGVERREIMFRNSEFPTDYEHLKSFEVMNADYEDARWVLIYDLLSLKNCSNISIGNNNLTPHHLRKFFKRWFTAECDMFLWMDIALSPEKDFDELISREIVFLEHKLDELTVYFTLAQTKSPDRKYPLLCIQCVIDLRLTAWAIDEPFRPGDEPDPRFGKEYEILLILERKAEMERIWNHECLIMEEWERQQMMDEAKVIMEKLDGYGVTFNHGMALIQS